VALDVGYAPGPQWFTNRDMDYWGRVRPALLASSVAVGICTVVSCVWVYFLQVELRWAIYRHISGSVEMLRRYITYQVRTRSYSNDCIFISDCFRRFCWS
jgi:hypothetical protein